ncbi:MAG: hypothetical protein B1H02_00210 [Candidatus Latescibacteria bacterium 4484_107]|nr:MAG: hypothetical protein B1H02_00210 [Candidatus Latescibacteria bacterium 4484_107]
MSGRLFYRFKETGTRASGLNNLIQKEAAMRGTSLKNIVIRSALIMTISLVAVLSNAWAASDQVGDFPIRNPQSAIRNSMELPTGLDPIQTALKEAFAANVSGKMAQIAEQIPQKSPKKALLFSALIPGAGQIYGGKLLRGAVFLTIDAALLTGYVVLDKKGGDLEDDFKAYADRYWDVDEYLVWKDQYVSATGDTMLFTHGLPRDSAGEVQKTQQYYEMIGKYDQFRVGWEDYPDDLKSITYADSVLITEDRLDYMDQRDDSNRYLKRAGYVTGAIFFNHIISAIDAARQVSGSREEQARSERRVKVRMAVWEEGGEPFPALVVSKRF